MTESATPSSANGRDPDSLSGFVRLLAHELGNPVASIRMSAEMLSGGAPEELHGQLYEILLSESGRLQKLIESAVYYTSMPVSEPHSIDLQPLLETIIERNSGGMEVHLTIAPDCQQISLDAALISRAVGELLRNASDAGASQVNIDVRCDRNDALLTVHDDGEGVSNDKISAIFQPFHTTREGQLGLGLSIARRIVQRHDGAITIAPGESGGTDVAIRLPLAGVPTKSV
jgi:signal transduction histidine kinase